MEQESDDNQNSDIIAYFLLAGVVIVWGSSWPLGRWMVGSAYGESIPPLMIAILRYLLAVIAFFIILKLKEKTLHYKIVRENWLLLVLMGFLSVTIYQAGFLYGESFTSGSDASLVVASGPIWVLLVASVVVNEKLTLKKISGAALAFLGVLIIVGFSPNVEVEDRLLGDFFILIAAFSYGVYTVLIRLFFNKYQNTKNNEKPSSLFVISWISLFGLIITIPIGLILNPEYLSVDQYFEIPNRIWIGILYLAYISTTFAYLAFIESVNRLNASRAAIFINFVPVVGVVLSAVFLDEIIDPFIHLLSFMLIVAGVTLVNRKTNSVNQK